MQSAKVCNGPGVSDLLSAAAWMGLALNLGHMWLGASRDMSNPPFGVWSWVDGTNATNINCGSSGCGPYGPLEPKYVSLLLYLCRKAKAFGAKCFGRCGEDSEETHLQPLTPPPPCC